MGIGISSFTEVVGAGPSASDYDILGIKMFDSAEIRIHPTGKAIARFGTKISGAGSRDDLRPDRRRRAGPTGERHRRWRRAIPTRRPTVWAPTPAAPPPPPAPPQPWRRGRSRPRPRRSRPTCWRSGEDDSGVERRPSSRSRAHPDQAKTIQEIAFAAYTNHPPGHGSGARGHRLLRPAEPHLPLRQLHLRRGHRQGHGGGARCGASWRWTIAATSSTRWWWRGRSRAA